MKTRAFWDIAPCSFVEVDRRFRGTYCWFTGVTDVSEVLTACLQA
jgi:hypothetical protein